MRSHLILLFVLLLVLAGCGATPALIPPTNQPGGPPAGSPTALSTPRPAETAAPPSAEATPQFPQTGTVLAGADDAIRLVQQRLPQLQNIKQMPAGSIGASTDITVQSAPGGWNLIFWQGSGDCPAGCINNHYWYVAVEKSGGVTLAGEFAREFDSGTNAVKTTGAPMWGVPRQ